MKIIRSLGEIKRDTNSVVTVGSFDGVHLAHREIIREVANRSRMREGRNVVITFDPHPMEVVASPRNSSGLLSTIDERVALLSTLNIDVLYIIDFTYEFSRSSPVEFYQTYVVNGIGVSEVVVGYDHMFGRDRQAGVEGLVRIGQQFNFSVFAVHPYMVNGELVSSTEIRTALLEGNLEKAKKLLGYSYGMKGTVVSGDGRGKTIGYPTANIKPLSEKKIIPARGVYFVSVQLMGKQYFGMMNIGIRPTVTDERVQMCEVHILDFDNDIYGENVSISFLRRLRDEQKFASMHELAKQLDNDKEQSLKYIMDCVNK
ncbi:MAG: bifunctional riboflavin kinase/FAD synthetase [Ignavibacteria bacterium]|nr:bifunctional riboflavin kinase/FAD synthetase [Ignavibacteria bacterium]